MCRQLIEILKSNCNTNAGQPSSARTELPPSYQEDFRKFLEDAGTSLHNHAHHFNEKVDDINAEFQKFSQVWNNKVEELKDIAIKLDEEKRMLDIELARFKK